MSIVISIENLSKIYHLGQIGTGTFANDLNVWWAKARGKPNPFLKIGEKDYGNREGEELWALQDINISVEQGEVLGIIGRNGAGKSTLLKILSRVTAPSAGVVKVKGRIASLLEVGTGFHPELTGRENIYLNGAILGMSRSEVTRKLDEIIEFSGVENYIDTPVKRYSSGMYVRLAFAVAAHLEPDILVVDEVLAVGDAEFQKKSLGKMNDVAKDGRTVLFVSHNMASIQQLTHRCILLSGGKIGFDSTPSSTIEQYTAMLIMADKNFNPIALDNLKIWSIKYIVGRGYSSPLVFEMDLEFYIQARNFKIGIGINNSLDHRIITSEKVYEGVISGRKKIMLSIHEPRLTPGHYSLSLGISSSIIKFYQPNIYRFSISPIGYSPEILTRNEDLRGVYIPLEISTGQ